ncbi:uncharacterized protein Z520_04233 [Fonsecaea multimorphosa CBS 102226]|uniref:Leucine carboxyl methyltransferase 1 n=1 Tax=Fonsecaea multimorphosa CBS 102226 TaxID=1442371 RepID=A0A0D2HCG9_9EURO|nr:uncharacterized protein Z520_04233 [Fonsecaea multimorphosa CBS 102226]KIX99600.1 hypothetical protein Z520_04233 [Fonsecaea multimorphosa CBS 102226]OAL26840.1 hypothetical protein AYO22_04007 [Fonsecaea multimorphosa]
MSAPAIPNLNSLRRGGQRGRGRSRADHGGHAAVAQGSSRNQHHHDEIVQSTDNDAATSRQSAVDAGYLEDPFSALLHTGGPVSRRLPLMNRGRSPSVKMVQVLNLPAAGTYVRTTCIDRIVDTFLSSAGEGRKQIISLGAGSDTRYFRLRQKRRKRDVIYHELDFEANTRRKIIQLRSPSFEAAAKQFAEVDMRGADVQVSNDAAGLVSPDYVIHPQDLRHLPHKEAFLTGMDMTLPTLIISECCLVYLPPDGADAVLHYFSKLFPKTTPLAIAIYEPIRPYDSFGKTMVSNLMSRGIQLQTLEKYAGLEEQRSRLRSHGFGDDGESSPQGAEAADIDFIWQTWIAPEEKERVDGLEWMDEVEEFVLLAKHYCICWGWKGFGEGSRWKDLPSPTS